MMFSSMRTNVSVFFSFLLGNALFATVLGTQYFKTLPSWPTDGFGASFLVGSLWSQLGLLTLMIGVLGLPFASVPLRWARWAWILIASMGLIILYVVNMAKGGIDCSWSFGNSIPIDKLVIQKKSEKDTKVFLVVSHINICHNLIH